MSRGTQMPGTTPAQGDRCWAFDQEADSALVSFEDTDAAGEYVRRQNAHQGRERWILLDTLDRIPDRADGTPSLLPEGRGLSVGGFHLFDCAQALDVAAALAHASTGRRRIAGHATAGPVDDMVDLEIETLSGDIREWRFHKRDARLLAARIATLVVICLPIATGEKP